MHSYERIQKKAIELEKQIKNEYSNKSIALQLIAGAKEAVNYSYQKERDIQWFIKYINELERRL